jgi:hypothetical protein
LPDTITRYLGLSFFPLIVSLAAIVVPVLVWTHLVGDLTFWPFIGLIVFCGLLYAAVILTRNPELLAEIRGWISELRSHGGTTEILPGDDDPIKRG